MRLRIRGPQGVSTISIEDTATWGELKSAISSSTSVPEFDVKYGYPPKALDTTSIDAATQLSDIGISLNGEQLTIVPINLQAALSNPLSSSHHPPAASNLPSTKSSPPKHQAGDFPSEGTDQPLNLTRKKHDNPDSDPPLVPVPNLDGQLVLRVMPDDNSCMFRALSSAVLGSALDGMTELRSVVAQTIQANPELYTTGMLEKEPSAYCEWITREDSWGGGIELSILSQHFDIEIASVNVQDLRVDRFNEGKPTRCILVYSGIHYDVVAVTPFSGAEPEFDRKVFDVIRTGDEEMDGGALEAAVELCKVLQSRHYYTDTHGFTVKCNQCGQTGTGQQWAVQHARGTGHGDFGEG
jgi:ubiquitin thioesterase OTU1